MSDGINVCEQGVALAKIIMQAGDDTEHTDAPYWYIATKSGLGGMVNRGGPFFSRERAEAVLKGRSHRFPKSAFVYCDSGHFSDDYREMRRIAKLILKVLRQEGEK